MEIEIYEFYLTVRKLNECGGKFEMKMGEKGGVRVSRGLDGMNLLENVRGMF